MALSEAELESHNKRIKVQAREKLGFGCNFFEKIKLLMKNVMLTDK